MNELLAWIETQLSAWWRGPRQGGDRRAQWWPETEPFWVAVGAVLTQNTNWQNVEQALDRLRRAVVHDDAAMRALSLDELAELIRPSGYYRVKADRLQHLLRAWQGAGGAAGLAGRETDDLRSWLLAIKGIGPETADDILLYGFGRPVFIVDTYTRRLLDRLGRSALAERKYEGLRAELESGFSADVQRLGDMHGLIVEHAKRHCRVRPLCAGCPLTECCVYEPSVGGS